MKPALSKAEFTASQRPKLCALKKKQCDKIVSTDHKTRRDGVTPTVLRAQQRAMAGFLKSAPKHEGV